MWSLRAGALLSPDAIRSALAAGAEVNKEAPDNRRTALHYAAAVGDANVAICLLYTSPSPRDGLLSRMPSSA